MKEVWKDVKNYEGLYKINSYGEIKNRKGHKIKPDYNHTNNIFQYHLYKNGKKKIFSRGKLIAEHFIPNPNNYNAVIHIDKNSTNDKISNLKWINLKDTFFNGTERAKKVVYNEKEYNSIVELYRQLKKQNPKGKATYFAFLKRIKNNWNFNEAILVPCQIFSGNKNGKIKLYHYKGTLKLPRELVQINKIDIKSSTLRSRLYQGWTAQEAIEIPVQKRS